MNVITKPPKATQPPEFGEPGWRPSGVHPGADAFQMLPDDELAALAEDIKANGLIHPIVTDADGLLIDGRNRLAACELAGVEPTFALLKGDDPLAFIASANLNRRNLTAGQRAMGWAFLYPDAKHGGARTAGASLETKLEFSTARLSQARSVLRHSQALAESIRDGHKSLDEALKAVADERAIADSAETKLAELQRDAPDLSELVAEERLKLDEAHSTMKKRQADAEAAEANKRETILRLTEGAWRNTTAWASPEFVSGVSERLKDEAFRVEWLRRLRHDPEMQPEIMRGAKAFEALVKRIIKGSAK